MIPIGDDKLRNVPWPFFTWLVIVANALVFIYELSIGPNGLEALIMQFGVIPYNVVHGAGINNIVPAMFIHAGWMHIIGNMLFLWVFGDNIEAALGHAGFLIYYLAGGAIAAIAHTFSDPASLMPMVGASGAISATLGSYIIMFPSSRVRTLIPLGFFFTTIRVSAWIFLGVWIVIQLISGSLQPAAAGGTAWYAHIGGFAFGIIIGFIFRGRARRIEVISED